MLKQFVKKIEDVEEAFRSLYKEEKDGFYLETDDTEMKGKLNEFRQSNVDLLKKEEEHAADILRFKDVDPTKHAEAMEALAKLKEQEEKDMIESGDVDKLLETRTTAMKEAHDLEMKAMTTARDEALGKADLFGTELKVLKIDQGIATAVADIGTLKGTALLDMQNRARNDWKLDDKGQLVTERFGKDGEKMSPKVWAQDLLDTSGHLFEGSKGGGSEGGGGIKPPSGGVLSDLSPISIGRNMKDLASGKVKAVTT